MDNSDVLIVGGGSAGAVVASRLSENPQLRVRLVEAGRDTPPDAVPSDIADTFPSSYANTDYFWSDISATILPNTAPRPYPQARIMGGGSSVMGMWALRGQPGDYDGWAAAGATGWAWSDVVPYFKKLESDSDFSNADHGNDGPVVIARDQRSVWPVFTGRLAAAAERRQMPELADLNTTTRDGIAAIPLSVANNTRVTSASAYLTAAVRERQNLEILDRTEVRSLVFDGKKAIGVDVRRADGSTSRLQANEIILSTGGVHSPALLQRSGIGNGEELSARGIEVVADLPGVGRNLQNHFYVHFGSIVRREARQDAAMRRYGIAGIRLSSGIGDAPPADLFLGFIARSSSHSKGNRIGMIATCLYSNAARGSVTLDPGDPGKPPIVVFNALDDPDDRKRLLHGARLTRDLLLEDSVRSITHESFVIPQSLPIRLFSKPGPMSAIANTAAAAVFGMNAGARRAALRMMVGSGRFLSDLYDDDAFSEVVLSSVLPMFHVCGTCAIGAVVDSEARVQGIDGLRVVDASIMPVVPRANTNIPTIMVAEKCADHIAESLRRR